ncbi:HNH endonuclease signature motif containing protein [Nocardioides caeni]|nr:HNH endonuclease signature motif containing protein [Nocardioides caeni]
MSIAHAARQRAKELEPDLPGTTFGQRQITALAEGLGLTGTGTGTGKRNGPRVKIYLHLAPGSPIARMEGHGPVTRDYVRHPVRDIAGHVRVQPVSDLNQTIAVDAYEIPHRLRQAVRLIHPGDVFPYAVNLSREMDLDHQIPHGEGGETSTDNLGPVTRSHHRIKTHDNWEVRQPNP